MATTAVAAAAPATGMGATAATMTSIGQIHLQMQTTSISMEKTVILMAASTTAATTTTTTTTTTKKALGMMRNREARKGLEGRIQFHALASAFVKDRRGLGGAGTTQAMKTHGLVC